MKLVLLLLGLVFLTACNGEFPVDLPALPGSDKVAVPADRPTAGHAVTPNPFFTESVEWLWDPQGIYLLSAGSNIAQEIFNEDGQPVANVQGVAYSQHNIVSEDEFDYFVWLWTPIAVYRYKVGDAKLLRVRNTEGEDIREVQGFLSFPGSDDTNDEVWLWTAENFYRLVASVFDGQLQFSPYREPLANIQAVKPTPDPRYVFIWTTLSIYLYDTIKGELKPVSNPAGAAISGVRGFWLNPIVTIEEDDSFFTVWVWNDMDLYQMPFPPREEHPPQMVKISNDSGGGINEIQGIAMTLNGSQDVATLWAWTPRALYVLPQGLGGKAVQQTLTVGDITLDTITATATCPDAAAPLYVWNANYLMTVSQYDDDNKQLIPRADGLVRHNGIRQVLACPLKLTEADGMPDEVWWWDNDGFYRRMDSGWPAVSIQTPEHQHLVQMRGLAVGLSRDGAGFWIWNASHVYQFFPDGDLTEEIMGPDGLPLANTWITQMRPESNELTLGYTVLIRNSLNVYHYVPGNDRALAISVGNDRRAVTSPAYTLSNDGVVTVGQSAHFATTAALWPQLNVVLQPGGDAAAKILTGSGHCHIVPPGNIHC